MTDNVMHNLKTDLKETFNVMDLGESSKIVDIEITHKSDDSITIGQPLYIESIL
jgi:hypothetical protein